MKFRFVFCISFSLMALVFVSSLRAELPLPVSEVRRDTPVDFAKEIAPLLKQNCLACHHAKEAEGGLNLETHASVVKGGDSGPGVVPKDLDNSLLMTRATGAEEPLMPPEDNKVGAKPLTPEQLGLIKLWIEQGAPGSDAMSAEKIQWQPIPEAIRTIYAIDVSADGRLMAAGRGNRVSIFDLQSKAEVARLVDPELANGSFGDVTDHDLIQSLAFSPDGVRLATGGFRNVKIWRKDSSAIPHEDSAFSAAAGLVAMRSDGSAAAMVNALGDVEIRELPSGTLLQTLASEIEPVSGLAWSGGRLFTCDQRGRLTLWDSARGERLAQIVSPFPLVGLTAADEIDLVAAIDDQRQPRIWRWSETDSKFAIDPITLEATNSIKDANALLLSAKPSGALVVASETAGVMIVNLADGKQIRKVDHGAAVDALAVTSDGTQLATGGRDGKTRTWSLADGKPLATLQGDPVGQLRLTHATVDMERQKAAVARLNARTAELEKTVTKEAEALKKLTEERDKAVEAVAAEEKKRVDAAASLASTEAAISKAKTDSEQATKVLEKSNSSLADATKRAKKLTAEMQTETAALAKANEAAAAAQKQIDVANQALAAAKAEAEKFAKAVQERKTAVDLANKEAMQARQAIDAANKTIVDAKKQSDDATKQVEAKKKAVTDAVAAKQGKEKDLAKRVQAFDTGTLAHQRAVDAVPEHKNVIAVESRRQALLEQTLTSYKQEAVVRDRPVVGVCYAADGQTVATVTESGTTRLYRASDGLPLVSLASDSWGRPAGVVLLGDQVCRFGHESAPKVWPRQPRWVLERTIGGVDQPLISDRVTALDFRPDGRTVAIGSGPPSRSGEVMIFSVPTGQLVRDFGAVHSDTVLGLRFSPDGRSLASSAADKTVRLLNIANGQVVRALEGHTHHVLALDWQDDGETIASASADQNVKVWNVGSGEQRRTIGGFSKEITAITFVQRTNQVVSACADGQVRLHDTGNGKALRTFNAGGDFLFALSITPDGKTMVAGGQSGTIRVWTVADGKLIHEWK